MSLRTFGPVVIFALTACNPPEVKPVKIFESHGLGGAAAAVCIIDEYRNEKSCFMSRWNVRDGFETASWTHSNYGPEQW